MKHLALTLSLALVSIAGCKKKDDTTAPAAGDKTTPAAGDKAAPGGDKPDVADVDCEKMTTHNVEVLMKDAVQGKTDEQAKTMQDSMKAQHGAMVKACEDEKGTKKLTHKQYDCILASQSTTELTSCVTN